MTNPCVWKTELNSMKSHRMRGVWLTLSHRMILIRVAQYRWLMLKVGSICFKVTSRFIHCVSARAKSLSHGYSIFLHRVAYYLVCWHVNGCVCQFMSFIDRDFQCFSRHHAKRCAENRVPFEHERAPTLLDHSLPYTRSQQTVFWQWRV